MFQISRLTVTQFCSCFYSQNCQHLKIIVGIIVTYKAWHGIIVTYKKIIISIENRVISYMSFGDNNDGFLTSHLRQLKCIIYDPNNLFQNFICYSIYLMFLNHFFGNNQKKQTVHAYTRKCLILGNFYVCKYFFYSIHCFFIQIFAFYLLWEIQVTESCQ